MFETTRRVEFRDTDAAGITHFSVFMTWMEEVEHEALRSVGLSVMPQQNLSVSWPRVKVECEYFRPVRFEEVVTVKLTAERIGGKSINYRFDFETEESIACGRVIAVCCKRNEKGVWASTQIPDDYHARLEQLR